MSGSNDKDPAINYDLIAKAAILAYRKRRPEISQINNLLELVNTETEEVVKAFLARQVARDLWDDECASILAGMIGKDKNKNARVIGLFKWLVESLQKRRVLIPPGFEEKGLFEKTVMAIINRRWS